jgi:hypothetical protein
LWTPTAPLWALTAPGRALTAPGRAPTAPGWVSAQLQGEPQRLQDESPRFHLGLPYSLWFRSRLEIFTSGSGFSLWWRYGVSTFQFDADSGPQHWIQTHLLYGSFKHEIKHINVSVKCSVRNHERHSFSTQQSFVLFAQGKVLRTHQGKDYHNFSLNPRLWSRI